MDAQLAALWLTLWGAQIAVGATVLIATRNLDGAPVAERTVRASIMIVAVMPLGGYGLIVQAPLILLLVAVRSTRRAMQNAALQRLHAAPPLPDAGVYASPLPGYSPAAPAADGAPPLSPTNPFA